MSAIDVKALRALLDDYKKTETALDAAGRDAEMPTIFAWRNARTAWWDALNESAPALLTLAEAVRDLAPVLADLNETGAPSLSAADRDNLRALLAILDTPPRAAGDDR